VGAGLVGVGVGRGAGGVGSTGRGSGGTSTGAVVASSVTTSSLGLSAGPASITTSETIDTGTAVTVGKGAFTQPRLLARTAMPITPACSRTEAIRAGAGRCMTP